MKQALPESRERGEKRPVYVVGSTGEIKAFVSKTKTVCTLAPASWGAFFSLPNKNNQSPMDMHTRATCRKPKKQP